MGGLNAPLGVEDIGRIGADLEAGNRADQRQRKAEPRRARDRIAGEREVEAQLQGDRAG